MSDDIPFDKSFDLPPETVEEVAPGVRRLLANNPSPFTFKGTMSYIVGRGHVAIIDPGPLDEAHIAALLDAVRGETVTHIFVTHTHRDHSPAVPRIKAATGALVLAEGPHRAARPLHIGEAPRLDASNDTEFRPIARSPTARSSRGPGWTIEAVTTPGHTANHMAFAYKEANLLVLGRPCHGVVDARRRAAGRGDERLHGLAGKARAPLGAALPARSRRRGARGAALRAALHPPSPGSRGLDPAPAGQRRSRYSHPCARASISGSIRGW